MRFVGEWFGETRFKVELTFAERDVQCAVQLERCGYAQNKKSY